MSSTDIFQIAARHMMGPRQKAWWANFDLLRAFGEEHGHFNIPPGPLRNIASNIRQYWVRGVLESEKIAALNAINFPKCAEHGSIVRAETKLPKDVARLIELDEAAKNGGLSDDLCREARTLKTKLEGRYMNGGLSPVHAKRFGFG